MRAFIAMRKLIAVKPSDKLAVLHQEIIELKLYLEEKFNDQNDINENTRMQIELINQSLAELQSEKSMIQKQRRRVGYIMDDE